MEDAGSFDGDRGCAWGGGRGGLKSLSGECERRVGYYRHALGRR